MSHFVHHTINDLRNGRETWRVFIALCGPSFTIAVLLAMLRI